MLTQIALSSSAVFTLRNEITGYRMPVTDRRRAAYRELAAAGIMEPVPGSESAYQFTEEGLAHREAICRKQPGNNCVAIWRAIAR